MLKKKDAQIKFDTWLICGRQKKVIRAASRMLVWRATKYCQVSWTKNTSVLYNSLHTFSLHSIMLEKINSTTGEDFLVFTFLRCKMLLFGQKPVFFLFDISGSEYTHEALQGLICSPSKS